MDRANIVSMEIGMLLAPGHRRTIRFYQWVMMIIFPGVGKQFNRFPSTSSRASAQARLWVEASFMASSVIVC